MSWTLNSCLFHKLRDETKSDPELQQFQKVVMSGWPHTKVETPVETRPYWNQRDKISCYEGFMFKGDRIIVPHSLRPGIHAAEREPGVQCFGQVSIVQSTSWYPVSNTSKATRESL